MGDLKNVMYHRKLSTLVELRQEIENAAISLDTLGNVVQAVLGHTHKCLEAHGHRIEHLL